MLRHELSPRQIAIRLFAIALATVCLVSERPAAADTVVLPGGRVLKEVVLVRRGIDGTLEINHSGNLLTLPRERYVLHTSETLLVLASGDFVAGEISDTSETSLTLNTREGPQRFSRREIARIVLPDGSEPDPATVSAEQRGAQQDGTSLLAEAETSMEAGDPVAALRQIEGAIQLGLPPGSNASAILARTNDVLRERADQEMQAGRFTNVRSMFEESLRLLDQPRMTVALGGPATQAELVEALTGYHHAVYVRWVRGVLRAERRLQYEQALEAMQIRRSLTMEVLTPLFQNAPEPNAPQNSELRQRFEYLLAPELEVRLLSIELLARLDRVSSTSGLDVLQREVERLRMWKVAFSGGSFSHEIQQEIHRIETLTNNKRQVFGQPPVYLISTPATPTPVPTPTPEQERIVIVHHTPTPTPTPVPPKSQAEQYLEDYLFAPYRAANEFCYRHTSFPLPAVSAMLVGLILFNWWLPRRIVRNKINEGNIDWEAARGAVNWFGLPALLGFLALGMRPAKVKERKSGARCEHCNARIENIDNYPDLEFGKCPQCGGQITAIYTLEDYIQHLIGILEGSRKSGNQAGMGTVSMGVVEKDAMQKLLRSIVTLGIRRRASDVHIEPDIEGANVRMRIDGVLYDMVTIPRTLTNAVVSALKVMANLDISEHRIPQDGKVSMWIDNSDVDIRINTAPHQVAERVTMRLLDSRAISVESNKLGLEGRNLESFEQIIRRPSGVVYITGPTGSGKTTTLYVALNTINDGRRNIVTIEDPIEYQLKGINQMQVNTQQGFTFASGLRSILRSDPDVIMVGEVRDKETADIAVDAASTGHLVFTTLHTIDSTSVVSRLFDLGVEPRRVASSMLAAIAQRLVRVNCPHCKKPYSPSPAELKQVDMGEQKVAETTFFRGEGCDECSGTGFQGRIGLFEIFIPDDGIKEMITDGKAMHQIKEQAQRRGLTTIREEALVKIERGLTTVDEVIRST